MTEELNYIKCTEFFTVVQGDTSGLHGTLNIKTVHLAKIEHLLH